MVNVRFTPYREKKLLCVLFLFCLFFICLFVCWCVCCCFFQSATTISRSSQCILRYCSWGTWVTNAKMCIHGRKRKFVCFYFPGFVCFCFPDRLYVELTINMTPMWRSCRQITPNRSESLC